MFRIKMIFSACLMLFFSASSHANDKGLVVLLHGIKQAEWNMAGIERALKKSGYETVKIGYPSTDKNIDELSKFLNLEMEKQDVWDHDKRKVHFVTHSMGGLVVRTYLDAFKKQIPQKNMGRVVMLAPPNKGSEVADLLHEFKLYKWIYGPAGQDLTTIRQEKIKVNVYYDLGIIAGSKQWPYIIAAHIIPDKSDGRVAVEKTKLKGMTDHVELSATHTFISWKPTVHKQIIHFLEYGEFNNVE